ncbi:MAG: ribonuclease Y [Sedimentisphaerales bacterium]|nr:ribonuclease Y [Sedimentisphaerales bacterium]
MDTILMQVDVSAILAVVAGLLIGISVTWIAVWFINKAKARTLHEDIDRQLDGAKKESENIIRAAQIEAAAETIKRKEQFNAEANQIRAEFRETEIRLTKREDVLDKQVEQFRQKEQALQEQGKEVERRLQNVDLKDKQLTAVIAQQKNQLLKMTAMSIEEAKEMLLKRLEDECELEMSALIQRKVDEAVEKAADKGREIISTAIQRYVAEQTCEVTVSAVEIPNDDMKGRIIGREGRNIRAFEKATGVDVIVDDTPGTIVVSGFDPVRREVARLSMERLIQDGRIHPSRIEELVAQTKKDINAKVLQLGKDAAVETNVRGLNNRVMSMIGALNYRTSYGQNVLRHSVEVAFLSQVMADELGLDGSIARRAGLLHDIGKALDHEIEGSHPVIGANFLRRFNESPVILNAVEGHHGDLPPNNPYTPLVAAADAISASRPGARRETLERYIKRLEKLEEIANSFPGVENAYAIQAGREIRVIVNAEKVPDESAAKVARDIAKKVEAEMTYPGEIQVTLLRELRCIEYAR